MSFIFAIWLLFLMPLQAAETNPAVEKVSGIHSDSLSLNSAANDTIPRDPLPGLLYWDGKVHLPRLEIITEEMKVWAGELPVTAEEIPDTVYVWTYRLQEAFEVAETDSTLRWTKLLNLFDRFYQEKGAITYRMGTVGRMDGIEHHSFETRHMNLEMEGLNLNDPLTGAVNWNRLPIHKIDVFKEADYGAAYRSQTRLRDHYLVQPRTYLNFDESKFNHRSLEFSYTQNFKNTTNLELSFWDRRDGGGYNRQEVDGRQIVARAYHQLNDRWLLKGAIINNDLDRQEPFGYAVTDPQFFNFNRFIENPLQPGSSSNQASNDIYFQAHHRRSIESDVSTKFGLHYQTDKWDLTYNADTLATDFQKVEAFARQHVRFGPTHITGTGRLFLLNAREDDNLAENSWAGGDVEGNITQHITRRFQINGSAKLTQWNDNRSSQELSARLLFRPFRGTSLSVFGGILSRSPDIQSMYWRSNQFSGNTDLVNEESSLAGAAAELALSRSLQVGFRGDLRETENAIFIDSEGQFTTIDPYTMISTTAWFSLDSRIFEGEISGTYKTYSSNGVHPINEILATSGDRIWLKGNIYWKNYLFDQATYVKTGFSGVFSPNAFRTAEFITPLNRWQHGTNEFVNPSYYRLDFDVSARVRWFMVLIKWENILDRVEQLGYFESTGFPMPERRFRFGIRVLFTN